GDGPGATCGEGEAGTRQQTREREGEAEGGRGKAAEGHARRRHRRLAVAEALSTPLVSLSSGRNATQRNTIRSDPSLWMGCDKFPSWAGLYRPKVYYDTISI